jgi:hypothetical protein
MSDPIERRIVQPSAVEASLFHRRIYIAGAAVVAGILGLAVLWWAQNQEIGQLRADGNTTAVQAQQLADQVRSLGGTPVVEPATPGPQGPQGPSGQIGATGPGPTDAQIDAAVTRYLAAHPPAPGQSATPAMVATAVAQFLAANPPAPGRPPTAQEIIAATTTYLAAHTGDFRGPAGAAGSNGQNGQNGKDATDAQVSAAVDAYCTAHNACTGPAGGTGKPGKPGDQGQQGVSVTDVAFARDSSGKCQVVVTLHDPAAGTDTTVTHSAGDAACPITGPGANSITRPSR